MMPPRPGADQVGVLCGLGAQRLGQWLHPRQHSVEQLAMAASTLGLQPSNSNGSGGGRLDLSYEQIFIALLSRE